MEHLIDLCLRGVWSLKTETDVSWVELHSKGNVNSTLLKYCYFELSSHYQSLIWNNSRQNCRAIISSIQIMYENTYVNLFQ